MEEKNKGVIRTFHKGVVYEPRERFDESVFHKVYCRASALVEECVKEQIAASQQKECPDNIITFIGRRGTGKSSAMLSFMEGLKYNHEQDGASAPYTINIDNKKQVQFIRVDWIDASMLEKGEDIFETILAKMLGEFLNEDNHKRDANDIQTYERRDLYNSFAQIYKKVLNIKKRNENKDFGGETAISTLRELARSNDLRIEFENLVKKYIEVKKHQVGQNAVGKWTETFLVLAIDDVDMNVESGFEILEKIQRYLKVERLIVLLSINYEQMKICCEKHFAKVYSDYSRELTEEQQTYVSKLSEEYMEKALPAYMRVYLPSLKKRDYDRTHLTHMEIKTRKNFPDVDSIYSNGKAWRKYEVPIKRGVLLLMEQKTMVRYDGLGKKRHFMEPGTLRSLNNYCVFLQSMESLDEKEENFLESMDFNYRRSMDDLLFRFAFENLPSSERKWFVKLSEEDIRRRGEIIVSRLQREIKKRGRSELVYINNANKEELIHIFIKDSEIFGYSYGELVKSFYYFGREKLFDERLVHTFLAMYSLVLTKIFYRYKKGKEKKKKNRTAYNRKSNYMIMKEILADSVAGSWALTLLPKMKSENIPVSERYAGAVKSVFMGKKCILFDANVKKCLEAAANCTNEEQYIEKMAELINSMTPQIIVLLFLSKFQAEERMGEKESFYRFITKDNAGIKVRGDDGRKRKVMQGILFKAGRMDYNVLNFVNNIFIFDEIMEEFIAALCSQFKYQEKGKEYVISTKVSEKLLENTASFYAKMRTWTKDRGGMVIPVYATDIYYNMIKRMVRNRDKNPAMSINSNQLFLNLLLLLDEIENHLRKEDDFYGDSLFTDNFIKCPVIEELRKVDKNRVEDIYNKFVSSLIDSKDSNSYKLTELDNLRRYLD